MALVAPSDYVYAVARMFQVYEESRGSELEVFRDLPSALEWMGLPPDLEISRKDSQGG